MRKSLKTLILLLAVIVLAGVRAYGEDVEFTFDIPTIPDPPEINSVTNSTAVAGSNISVFASISGTEQREVCCKGVCTHECAPNCDWDNCEMTDFTGQPDPRIEPNPTCIPNTNDTSGGEEPSTCGGKSGNPKLFYYYNGDPVSGGSVAMTYQSTTGNFTAEIPSGDDSLIEGDLVSYYIIASDNRGNVISQVPDPNVAPCTTLSSWDANYETPAINNCGLMNSYDRCSAFVSGSPTCGSTYSQNDPEADTCDEDSNVISGTNMDDVIGFTGGAGKGYQSLPSDIVVCSKIKLGASPPNIGSSSGPIDAYVMIFFNPDIIDPNPNDIHMINATAITYAPEAAGADPNLVKVLWDGECVTNPNTADPLGCKLIVGGSEVNELKIGAAGGFLTFIAKNALPNGDTMLGSSKGITKAAIASGNIQLDGGTPFWLTDLTAGYAIQRKNQEATLGQPGAPAPPLVPSPATCKSGGTSYTEGTCAQSTSQPSNNECYLTIYKSPDNAFTDQYKVYHATTNNVSTAQSAGAIGTITSNRDGQDKDYTDSITTLDGKVHYYWVSSVNVTDGNLETDSGQWAATNCTVEDWVPPSAPSSVECATPTGSEAKCECTWVSDTNTDPSIRGFNVTRDTTELVDYTSLPAAAGATNYTYTDSSAALTLGTSYTYKVEAVDAGSNISDPGQTSCTPEDLKAPSRVDTLGVTLKSGALAVNLSWAPGSEEDLAGYNVYKCQNAIPGASCIAADSFDVINPSLIAHAEGGNLTLEDTDFTTADEEWCFWVEACDNCDSEGNCPSSGEANCSTFDTLKTYLKCLMVTQAPDETAPLYPDSTITEAPAVGGKCELEWSKVCGDDEPFTFPDCNFPDADRLMGYYIMRAESSGSDCSGVTVDTNPVSNSLGHLVSSVTAGSGTPGYTDSGLTNGTTYCYRIHGYDAANNFSREDPAPNPVACTPMDTLAPDDPEISGVSESEVSCSISWDAVEDPDTVTYNLYRCDDTPANCSEGEFTTTVVSATTDVSANDFTVTTSQSYTYCVTATDGSANESSKFGGTDATDSANCTLCRAIEVPDSPSAVNAEASSGGFNAWWTDAGGTVTVSDYNVYSCPNNTTSDPATDCTLEVDGDSGSRTQGSPLNVASPNGSGDVYIAVTSVSEGGTESMPAFTDSTITIGGVAVCGDSTCADTETMTSCSQDCTKCSDMAVSTNCGQESSCEWTGTACQATCGNGTCGSGETVASCSADCSCTSYDNQTTCEADSSCAWDGSACAADVPACVGTCCPPNDTASECTAQISVSGTFKKFSVQSCTSADTECKTGAYKKVEVAQSGVVLELVDPNNNNTVLSSTATDENGQITSFKLSPTSDFTPGNTYVIRAKYASGEYDPALKSQCENSSTVDSDGYCLMELVEQAIGSTDSVSVTAKKVPSSGGDAMGGPMGDPNGDGTVNIFDLGPMKNAYGTTPSSLCYKAWADLNLDGTVNLFDLAVIKENYGKQFDKTSGYNPTLSKTNDDYSGDTSCCSTNSCD